MAREAKGWEALCLSAASERDPEKLQQIIVELNVLLESRQEELEQWRLDHRSRQYPHDWNRLH